MNYYAHYRKGRECGVNGIRNAISNFCVKTDVLLWIFFCIFALHDINIIFPNHAVFTRCLLWLAHQKAKVFYSTDLQLLHVFCYHFDTLCLCFYDNIRIICASFHFSIHESASHPKQCWRGAYMIHEAYMGLTQNRIQSQNNGIYKFTHFLIFDGNIMGRHFSLLLSYWLSFCVFSRYSTVSMILYYYISFFRVVFRLFHVIRWCTFLIVINFLLSLCIYTTIH